MATLSDNLNGSLAPEKDLVFPAQPNEPEMRESISVWLFEENGAFGFPRMGIGKTYEFKGVGTRIHRQSVRRLEGFFGHCWLSAVFPDGSAFGRRLTACVSVPRTRA